MKNLSQISSLRRVPTAAGETPPTGRRWLETPSTAPAGRVLLAIFVLFFFCGPSFAAVRHRPPELLKALAARLHREGRHLLNLRQDLQQVLAEDTSKDVSSITNMQLAMQVMGLAAVRFQCEARLIGVSLFIKDAYAAFYRQQRLDALAGLKEVTAGSLRDLKKSYTKITNNAALHITDLAQDTISDVLKHIAGALRPAVHK